MLYKLKEKQYTLHTEYTLRQMKEYEKIPFVFEWERILGCQKVKNEFYLLLRVLNDL
jgi:hypothetical protein